MRRVIVISYTETGRELNTRVSGYLTENGDVAVSFYHKKNFMSTDELLRQEWKRCSAIVFIGAMGIAVRHIVCYLMDKTRDPAVLVADERGQFVIPVLSGHIGGGVALAGEIAGKIAAQAVITTATDVERRFAVDMFACDNHLRVEEPEQIRRISAALLRGQKVDLWSGLPTAGQVPEGVCLISPVFDEKRIPALKAAYAVCLGVTSQEEGRLLESYGENNICFLKAGRYVLGIGCKKGRTADELEAFLDEVCAREGISKEEIAAVASVDRKKEEDGIWELSRRLCVPFEVFSAEELAQIEEEVTSSEFVRQTLGVDNVCERSAYCLAKDWTGERKRPAGMGNMKEASEEEDFWVQWSEAQCRLAVAKQAREGMTLALVELVWQ